MGYYYSDLTITANTDKLEEIQKEAEEIVDWIKFEREGGSIFANAKWYDHREFAKRLSELFPDVEFLIHRLGEGINEEWDEERYKVKDGEIYEEEILEVSTKWRRVSIEEVEVVEKFRETVRRIKEGGIF